MIVVGTHGPCNRRVLRMSTIVIGVEALVRPRCLHVLLLHRGRSHVPLLHRAALFGGSLMVDAAWSAVERDVIIVHDGIALHDRAINVNTVAAPAGADTHMHHGRVIGEDPSAPRAAHKSDAAVSESVVHAAIKANVRSPDAAT